ncbi:type II toxin-antitoxin system RelE/ParE family toxin [Paenibacillus sp. URB8-2]|uniref:type II toxin-antitoxin system RelE/ParE family toxin n=1 Tax=Paenibacillus sp. URB8-2 TaxID=2741301 RepID=UPI0015B8411C|nr:type II toxin-antitoxin system RelE/ParE family toxin [Paenibacillus sp. URB8-2]BCG58261.1 hypothetical protein PUR_16860 [Paenibacillus sp. URB8-2]
MEVVWSNRAAKSFSKIESIHFSQEETTAYKLKLLQRIEDKVLRSGKQFPSRTYENTYYIRIDSYIVSYEPSSDGSKYIITAFKHGRQNDKY